MAIPVAVTAGSGYIKVAEWFRIAFIMSIPVLLIWTIVGGAWMRVIGIWD